MVGERVSTPNRFRLIGRQVGDILGHLLRHIYRKMVSSQYSWFTIALILEIGR